MNITKIEMQAISSILTKEDKAIIAAKAQNSVRTVEAVMQSARHTEHIKKLIVQQALIRWEEVGRHLNAVQNKNKEFATVADYKQAKLSAMWNKGHDYDRYIDVYLQLSHLDYQDVNELIQKIKAEYQDVIQLPYYCIDLIVRLLGIETKAAVKLYNSSF